MFLKLILRALFQSPPKRKPTPRAAPPKPQTTRQFKSVAQTPRPELKVVASNSTSSDRPAHLQSLPETLTGKCYVIDGDTIQIGKIRLRLAGIDAPELEHPWGKKAKWELVGLCKGQVITAKLEPEISYDRPVATCYLPDGRDLSAEMVKAGLAIDWPKFSGGKYSDFEPEGIRKKHWKAAARQRGHMHVFHK